MTNPCVTHKLASTSNIFFVLWAVSAIRRLIAASSGLLYWGIVFFT